MSTILTRKTLVLGGRGLVGSGIVRSLQRAGASQVLAPTRQELDLSSQAQTLSYFEANRPEIVYLCAAKVGGIVANNRDRADFIFQNLRIQDNVFEAAFRVDVKKFLFMGSSCIYPRMAPQPIREDSLLTGPLEPTNEPYAIAKIAGLKTAESFSRQYGLNYFSVMPTNVYGVYDNFHPTDSHVIPGLIGRMMAARENGESVFKIWGTGRPKREFIYVDDLADACVFLMGKDALPGNLFNVGVGWDLEIGELAAKVARAVGFEGRLEFDTSKPDGTPRKLLDVSLLKSLGWVPRVDLDEGLARTVRWYRENRAALGAKGRV